MRRSLVFALFFPVCIAFAQQPGMLDVMFNEDGRILLDDVDSASVPQVVALHDRHLVLAYQRVEDGQQFIELRGLTDDGYTEPLFGDQGLLRIHALGSLLKVLVTSDGGILVVSIRGASLELETFVSRYSADGVLDTTYASSGINALTPLVPVYSIMDAMLLPDDRLYITGRLISPYQYWITRLHPDGSVDLSFGSSGEYESVETGFTVKIAVQSMDYLYVLGSTIRRLDRDGQQPMETIPAGSVRINAPLVSNSFGVGLTFSDQPINTFGAPAYIGIRRFTYSPQLPSGGTAYVFDDIYFRGPYDQGVSGTMYAATSDPMGNFLVSSIKTGVAGWYVHRYKSFQYGPDQTFSGSGSVNTPFFSSASAIPNSMTVQNDGKLVVAGTCVVDSVNRIVLARYHNIPDPRTKLDLRMHLGGVYDANTALMRDDLRQQGLLPNLQPYAMPFFPPANGVGAWAMPQHLLAVEGDEAVVDWVFLELISAADSSTVAATRVGILHRNGWVTSADGHSPIDFSAGAGSYFLRVRHRNHLGVTTSQPITLGPSTTTVDLTDPTTPTFGTDAQMDVNGVRMLWPGDANTDGAVKYFGPYNDRDKILQAIGGSVPTATVTGYRAEDVNLDGVVKYTGLRNDRDVILQTIGGTVPTAVRVEQRP